MQIKKIDFTPVSILVETADEHEIIMNIVSYAANTHPSQSFQAIALKFLEQLEAAGGKNA